MRNILILTQCMRKDFDGRLYETVERTWVKEIERYDNIRHYGYAAMNDDELHVTPHDTLGYIDAECKTVLTPYGDDLFSSFLRTICTMRTLVQHVKWADYILITRPNIYINIPLLNDFVQSIPEIDRRIYTSRVISAKYMSAPYSWCFYGEGSGILLGKMWFKYLLGGEWRNHVASNDHVHGPSYWQMYKHNVTDTAIGAILNDLMLWDDGNHCLELMDIDDAYVITNGLDHTLFWQDWGQDRKKFAESTTWPIMISIDCAGKDNKETIDNLEEVHTAVHTYYEENEYTTDMRYIQEYVGSTHTPIVTVSPDKPDCCIDDAEKVPFDDYHKWLEENSDIPNLVVNEDGDLVPGHEDTKPKRKTPYGPWDQDDWTGMTYAEYFNIPFWDHRCWYKHPWAGQNFCGCCQKEQLVYHQGSPSHDHAGSEDCGCVDGGSEGRCKPGDDYDKHGCPCHKWDVI